MIEPLLFIAIGGVGYGAFHPVSSRGILDWFDLRQRGTAMGIKQMGVTAGSATAALLLVPLAENFGWRPAVFLASLTLIIGGLICYWHYQDAITPLEKKHEKPREMCKKLKNIGQNKSLLWVTLGSMILSGAQISLNTYLIIYAHHTLLVPIVLASVLLVLSEIGGSFGRILWGIISDRLFGGRRLVLLSLIAFIATIAALIMGLLPAGTPFMFIALLSVVFGFCVSGYNGLWMNAATELVPQEQAGLASGFSTSIGAWGVIIGPPLFGWIIDATGEFFVGWFALGGMLLLVAALFMFLSWSLRTVD
ncbi:MFS transporter [Salicibibacter halophilus]|uniref:MFS transporter n=1 Tax=Salicibibacter halophilus TaxID=2502791 RepID=A0A514LK48_9BACI|nr:MFS transporter [Salicibibacter halophilus]QDI91915.1 MFS transporter [Salicibibacter halophilus]